MKRSARRQARDRKTAPPPPADARGLRREQLRFALKFVVLGGGLCLLYCSPYERSGSVGAWFHAYLGAYAKAVGAAVSLFDHTAQVSGRSIVGRFSVEIVRECDAMQANIIYVAGVLAFSASWARRAAGVIAGLVAIGVANVTRICALYFVGMHWPSWFDFAHESAQLFMVAAALGAFVWWAALTTPILKELRHASP